MKIIPLFDGLPPSQIDAAGWLKDAYYCIDEFIQRIKLYSSRAGDSFLFDAFEQGIYKEFGILIGDKYLNDADIDFINLSAGDLKTEILNYITPLE